MNFTDKLQMGTQELLTHGAATLVAFGDSVTHGALGINEFDYETVYWNRLKKRINALYPYVPVNALNAGIGGVTAAGSVARLERCAVPSSGSDHHLLWLKRCQRRPEHLSSGT